MTATGFNRLQKKNYFFHAVIEVTGVGKLSFSFKQKAIWNILKWDYGSFIYPNMA